MKIFARFCIVGSIGFVIDVSILQLLVIFFDTDPYIARFLSFLAAASATWVMNRIYTYKVLKGITHKEWLTYISFMAFGGVVNYCTYVLVINYIHLEKNQLWLGVLAGSVSGLFFNFMTSKMLFRKYEA